MTMQYNETGPGIAIGAEAFLDLGRKVDKVHDHLRNAKPIYKTVGGSTTMPASGTGLVICSESPARGRTWNILKVVLSSTDGHTVLAAAIVDIYAATLPDSAAPVLSELIQGNTPVPSVNYWSRLVEWCQSGEQVFGIIYGAVAAGSLINMAVRVAEYPCSAVEAQAIYG